MTRTSFRLPGPAIRLSLRTDIRRVSLLLIGSLLITALVALVLHVPSGATGSHLHRAGPPPATAEAALDGSSGAAGPHIHNAVLPAAAMEAAPAALATGRVDSFGQRRGDLPRRTAEPAMCWTEAPPRSGTAAGPGAGVPLPHTITIDTKATRSIAGFRYLPRARQVTGGSAVSRSGSALMAPRGAPRWLTEPCRTAARRRR